MYAYTIYIYIFTTHVLKLKSRKKKTLLHLELSGKASLSFQCKSHQRHNARHNSFPPSRIGEGPERKHLVPTCQTGVPCLIGSTPCCWWRGCFLGTRFIKLSVLPFTWSLDASKVFSTPFSAYFAKQQNKSKPTKETFIKFMSFSNQQRLSKTWFTRNQPTIWFGIHLMWYPPNLVIWVFPKKGKHPKMDGEKNGKPLFCKGWFGVQYPNP